MTGRLLLTVFVVVCVVYALHTAYLWLLPMLPALVVAAVLWLGLWALLVWRRGRW